MVQSKQKSITDYQRMERLKTCTKCKEHKKLSEFGRDKKKKDGTNPQCKQCNRERTRSWHTKNRIRKKFSNIQRRYGISNDDFFIRMEEQEWKCDICKIDITISTAYVDHCHDSGKVRGLLCRHCNTTLGQAKDNPETLRRAADYLERNK